MKQLFFCCIMLIVSIAASAQDSTKLFATAYYTTGYGKTYQLFYDKEKGKLYYMRTKKKRFYFSRKRTNKLGIYKKSI